ncbi:efflux RND transporter permease subunit [Alloacidobacterium dinghuense]|uniref:Efflux RND transporter permease subunit n=1 Tax=Alloacidobacterium dinghuense TaxID=2763107 RepID=A0A7G8BJM8_9BACT|nr:efflux RND transporter permease subunit [Alloacidobacterium dinghuense]QNI32748.1 efflux RND transporter permease subunit [Alloacidobacterium dinghuense]
MSDFEFKAPNIENPDEQKGFNLSALAVREKSVTTFFLLAIIIAGVVAYLRLGRAEDPTFTVKVFTVTAAWPGATAQEMQDLVAEPLEKRMQELKYYYHVDTFTRPGLAFLTVTLQDYTPPDQVQEEFYQGRKKIQDEASKLPHGVLTPVLNDEYTDVIFSVYALKSKGMPLRQLTREAEILRQDLLHVQGVKKVNILGEQPERIFVQFSYDRIATLGVKAEDIFDALVKQNTVTPAGSIDTSNQRVYVRLDGALDSLKKIQDTPVVSNGKVFKLSEIAAVTRGYEDPAQFVVHHNGDPAMMLDVVMKDQYNGLDLGRALAAEQQKIDRNLPAGITFVKVIDQSQVIKNAIDEFQIKFFVALLVVMVVSLFSLGWRVGIVVAAAVPLTLSATLVAMLAGGINLDRISLGALILALGLLVDDAIIAIETMVVKMEEGWDRINAASYAWSHTAAPMLAGTLVTIIGLMPIGFAQSSPGEYVRNLFWVVFIALLISWIVAVTFTPFLGVNMLPNIPRMEGGYAEIYETANYQRFRRLVIKAVSHKYLVAASVVVLFVGGVFGMGLLEQQFFPNSDRTEILVDVTMPQGASIEATEGAVKKLEDWLKKQPEAQIVTSYAGGGAPRFFLAYNPELPDPNFAKMIVSTADERAQSQLLTHLRQQLAADLVPEARVRASRFVFGPYSPWPVAFRVSGPDIARVRDISNQLLSKMQTNPHTRQANLDWGERAPTVHFVLDQDRLLLIGLTSEQASQQIQFLTTGFTVTQVREDIRAVDVVARTSGENRLDPIKLMNMTLQSQDGRPVPLSQVGRVEIRPEDPILKRRDRMLTITVECDIDDVLQPPEVTAELAKSFQTIIDKLPPGYSIEVGASVEEAAKANAALAAVFPIMIVCMIVVVILQVRSLSALAMTLLTAPLGLVGVVPILLIFHQPFGFDAILGLIALGGILMRNTLILIGQIKTNRGEGLDPFHALVEATVQRSRPVVLTALAAVLAFIPLTFSAFWGSLAYTLIGGTAVGTVLTLVFLPALYSIWFKVKPAVRVKNEAEQLVH